MTPADRLEIGFRSATLKALRVSTLTYERGGDARIDAGLDRLDVNRLKVNLNDVLTSEEKAKGKTPTFLDLLTDAHVGAVTADVTAKEFLKDGKLGQMTGTARIGLFGLDNVVLDADGGIHVTAGKLETQVTAQFDPSKGIKISIGTTTVKDIVFTKGADEVVVGQLTVPPTALSVNNDTDLEDITIDGPIRIDGKDAGGKALPAVTYTDKESGLTVTVKEGLAYGLKVTLKSNKFELLEIGRVVVTKGTFELPPDKPGKPEKPTSPMTHFISSFQVLDTAHGKVDIAYDEGIINTDVTTYKFTVEGGRLTHKEVWHRDNDGEKKVEEKDYDRGSLAQLLSAGTLAELMQLVLILINAYQVGKQEEEKQKGKKEPEKDGDLTKFLKLAGEGALINTTVNMKLGIDPGGVVPFKDSKGRTIGLLKIGGAKNIDNTIVIQGSPGKQLNIDLPSLVLDSVQWELSTLNLFLEQIKLTGSSIQLKTFPLSLSGKIDSAELTKLKVGKPSTVEGPPQTDDKKKAPGK
jgi:hypothetical protein